MNLALWIVAGLMAVAFAIGGVSKLIIPKEKIAMLPGGKWVEGVSAGFVKATGVLDLLAAAGLILPATLDLAPVLVPVAAVGVVLLMIGAGIVRLRYGSPKAIAGDAAYLVLAAFVAWGRLGPESFN
jgi:uncharacterized membrane protein